MGAECGRGWLSSISLQFGPEQTKVAVFVDVENMLGFLKRGGGEKLLARASELGVVAVRRAYGDFSNPTVAARQDELQRHGFDLVHTVHPAKAKSNSADISMTIDVMEHVCRSPGLRWIVLATGDSDFSPLFRKLRELGKGLVGVGPSSVLSQAVALSCQAFVITDTNRSVKPTSRGVQGISNSSVNDSGQRWPSSRDGAGLQQHIGNNWDASNTQYGGLGYLSNGELAGGYSEEVRWCVQPPFVANDLLLPVMIEPTSQQMYTTEETSSLVKMGSPFLRSTSLQTQHGPLSIIKPSERIYRKLLDKKAGGWGSGARDWGCGLSEGILVDALLSLSAFSAGSSDQTQAMAVLVQDALGNEHRLGPWSGQHGLEREQACRVTGLLQRCGFLIWRPGACSDSNGHWSVALPASVDMLRRRRDGVVLGELLTRCCEAGINFEPTSALSLLWSAEVRGGGNGVLRDPGMALEWVTNLMNDVGNANSFCFMSPCPPAYPDPLPLSPLLGVYSPEKWET